MNPALENLGGRMEALLIIFSIRPQVSSRNRVFMSKILPISTTMCFYGVSFELYKIGLHNPNYEALVCKPA